MPISSTKPTGLAAISLVMLAGCQSLGTRSSLARMRVVNLSPDTGMVDIYQGNTAVAYNLSYGAVTSYVPLAPGTSTITVDLAGSKQVLASAPSNFVAGAQYTLLINDSVTNLQPNILADPVPAASTNAPLVRFIHQAAAAGAVDIYIVPAGQRLTATRLVITNLAPGAATSYLPVPCGRCAAVMLPAGTAPSAATVAIHTGIQIDYSAGSVRSLILTDGRSPLSSGLQVIAAIDREPDN